MADKKVTDLALIDAVQPTDIVMVIDDPSGTPVNKKATVTQLLASGSSHLDYLGDYVSGTYNDGDIVVWSDGIAYMCVKNGTTTPPEVWPGTGIATAVGPPGPTGATGATGPPGADGTSGAHHATHEPGGTDRITTLALGTTSATTGTLRLSNADTIMARKADNSADIRLMTLDASNVLQIAQGLTNVYVCDGGVTLSGQAAGGGAGAVSIYSNPAYNDGITGYPLSLNWFGSDARVVSGSNRLVLQSANLVVIGPSSSSASQWWFDPSAFYPAGVTSTQDIGTSSALVRNIYVSAAKLSQIKIHGDIQFESALGSNNRTYIWSSADGMLTLTDHDGNSFSRLNFGDTNSGNPALKVITVGSSPGLAVRLANDSADAPLTAASLALSGDVSANGLFLRDAIEFESALGEFDRTYIFSNADGQLSLVGSDAASFDRLIFGPADTSHPALKCVGTALQVRLANDSAYAPFAAGTTTVNGDLYVTGDVIPITREQLAKIDLMEGRSVSDPGDTSGSRTLMSQSYVSGLSLRHDESLGLAKVTVGDYDQQVYQPLTFQSLSFQVATGTGPGTLVEHLRVQVSGGVTVGTNHSVDPGVGIIQALGLGTTPLNAASLTGTIPDARLSSNVALLNQANVFTANQLAQKTRPDWQLLYTGDTVKSHLMAHVTRSTILSNNLFFDGTNWMRDDVAQPSCFMGMHDGVVDFGTAAAGANPVGAALKQTFVIDAAGLVTVSGGTIKLTSGSYSSTLSLNASNGVTYISSNAMLFGVGAGSFTHYYLTPDQIPHQIITGHDLGIGVMGRVQVGSAGYGDRTVPAWRNTGARMDCVLGDNTGWATVQANSFYAMAVGNYFADMTVGYSTYLAGAVTTGSSIQSTGYLYPGNQDTGAIQASFYLSSSTTWGLFTNTSMYFTNGVYCNLIQTRAGGSSLADLTVTGGTNFVGGINCTGGNVTITNAIFTGGVMYPGRVDNGAQQSSWYIASHPAYGLYSNTGLYCAAVTTGAVLCASINTQGYDIIVRNIWLNTTGFTNGTCRMQMNVNGASSWGMVVRNLDVGQCYAHFFLNSGNGGVGSISQTDSNTYFNTSSDRRLKIDRGRFTDVTALREVVIHEFEWIRNKTVDIGVFAQDAYALFPNVITPGKDDRDPHSDELLVPWMTDYSKLVPHLIVGWQHHEAEIAALKAELIRRRKH